MLACIVIAAVALAWAADRGFVGTDDAYIHLRYIDNLRGSYGYGFNPGQVAYGDTSPPWVGLAAVVAAGAPDVIGRTKALAAVLFGASIVLFWANARLVIAPALGLWATATYAFDAWMLKWSASAMEVSLAATAVLVCVAAMLLADRSRTPVWGGLAFALGALVRPELAALFLGFLAVLAVPRDGERLRLRRAAVAAAVWAVVLVPWAAYAHAHFGSVLPYTAYAKTAGSTADRWWVGWTFLRMLLLSYGWVALVAGAIVVSLIRIGSRNEIPAGSTRHGVTLLVLGGWCALLPFAYSGARPQTPSPATCRS